MNTEQKPKLPVVFLYDPRVKKCQPQKIFWNGGVFEVTKLGYHHKYKEGNVLFHSFSLVGVSTENRKNEMFFKVLFDSTNLDWILEEFHDPEFQ